MKTNILFLVSLLFIISVFGCSSKTDFEVAKAKIQKISDPDKLKKISKSDDLWMRYHAFEKIDDFPQDFLIKTAFDKNESMNIRKSATSKITDQEILRELALMRNLILNEAAIEALTDQDIINEIALTHWHYSQRIQAIKKLDSQEALINIVISVKNRSVRYAAKVRSAAFARITDQNFIKKAAISRIDVRIRYEAIKRITDQEILYQVALHDKDEHARFLAVHRLKEEKYLYTIAIKGNDKESYIAISGVYDRNLLLDLAQINTLPYHSKNIVHLKIMATDPIIKEFLGEKFEHPKYILSSWKTDYENSKAVYREEVNIFLGDKVYEFDGRETYHREKFAVGEMEKTIRAYVNLTEVAHDFVKQLPDDKIEQLAKNSDNAFLNEVAQKLLATK